MSWLVKKSIIGQHVELASKKKEEKIGQHVELADKKKMHMRSKIADV